VIDGILTSASNPYWSLWWATIGLGYLLLSRGQGWRGVLAFFSGHILSDAAWYLFVGAGISAGRRWFTDRVYRSSSSPSPSGISGCRVLSASCSGRISSVEAST
jgi:threonine/homoserine/homoserine lactone efflux protein